MKRVLIAMLLVVSLLSTGIASGSYVQAKTQKYWVYDSAQAKVKGNKLVVKAPLYVGEKNIKKKIAKLVLKIYANLYGKTKVVKKTSMNSNKKSASLIDLGNLLEGGDSN